MKSVITLLALLSVAVHAQNTFTDPRDGKEYRTVKIGTQTWMAENLNYCDGDDSLGLCILGVCNNNRPENCQKYGRLYDWNEAIKACPKGWHLPDNNEWKELMLFLVSNKEDVLYRKRAWEDESYKNAGKYLKAKSGCNECGNGTDEYGFSALPGGLGNPNGSGLFLTVGDEGYWWSATEFYNNKAYEWTMYEDFNDMRMSFDGDKSYLFSVRCLQGEALTVEKSEAKADSIAKVIIQIQAPAVEKAAGKQFNPKIKYGSMTDARDGKTYKTVKIGNQTWMAENLNYNEKGSKCYGNNDSYCKGYGRLYNWEAAVKACPSGWHLPSYKEWKTLVDFASDMSGFKKNLMDFANGTSFALSFVPVIPARLDLLPISMVYIFLDMNGNTVGKKLRSNSGWEDSDKYGFSAMLGGGGDQDGRFYGVGDTGWWWSASSRNGRDAYYWVMGYGDAYWDYDLKSYLSSVRCIYSL